MKQKDIVIDKKRQKKLLDEENKEKDSNHQKFSESPTNHPTKKNEKKSEAEFWEKILVPQKIIRDAIHGDIILTELEIKLVDAKIFQRLRRIKQLGPTYLVYPSANHSRFEHSLGALNMAQKLIEAVNRNFKNLTTS